MAKLFRIFYFLKSIWAVIAALLVGSILIILGGSNPIEAYGALFRGAFFEYYGFATTLVKMSPLLLAGLAVVVPFRAGLFNVGAEGQMYIGALFATIIGLYLPQMPSWFHILLCSIAGLIGGGLWALIPSYLKVVHQINEVIVTLLMNYIAINIISYFVSGPMIENGAPYPYSEEITKTLWLPKILPSTDAHFGIIVGIIFAVVIYILFNYTSNGLSLQIVGQNPKAANYAGISVRRYLFLSLIFGGALAGLGGAYEVLGLKHRLFHLFSAGYGYDGIIVAFLANGHPLWAITSAMFLGGLRSGANIMQRAEGIPTTVVEAIQGLIVIFIAISLAFKFKHIYWSKLMTNIKNSKSLNTITSD